MARTKWTSCRKLAAKVEKFSKSFVHIEAQVLRIANQRQCKHFCTFVDHVALGVHRSNEAQKSAHREYAFVVMSLCGKNLHQLRNEQPQKKFSLGTALRIGLQTLEVGEVGRERWSRRSASSTTAASSRAT